MEKVFDAVINLIGIILFTIVVGFSFYVVYFTVHSLFVHIWFAVFVAVLIWLGYLMWKE